MFKADMLYLSIPTEFPNSTVLVQYQVIIMMNFG